MTLHSLRNKFEGSESPYFFFSKSGGKCLKLVEYFQQQWLELGFSGCYNFRNLRTSMVDYTKNISPAKRALLHRSMCHSDTVASKFYIPLNTVTEAAHVREMQETAAGKEERRMAEDRQQAEMAAGKEERRMAEDRQQAEMAAGKEERRMAEDRQQAETAAGKEERRMAEDRQQAGCSSTPPVQKRPRLKRVLRFESSTEEEEDEPRSKMQLVAQSSTSDTDDDSALVPVSLSSSENCSP
ncbi:caldesmon [Astyanax mexicanus]|uniref:caldesmon n=1 Tax=Astyanax mexicanus TaxID=7994 RepID=UPI0020CB282C|nr:caldesmon [Astyanax mexicanus]XP_049329358.1 caldesmon [Astyanax mexicanus]